MFSGDEPPDLIKGSYTIDLNINKIHEAIEARFIYFKNNVINFRNEISELENMISDTSNFSLNEIKRVKNEIKDLKLQIIDYEKENSLKKYREKALPLLEEYNKVSSNKSKGFVVFKKKVEEESKEKIEYRLKLIHHYLDHARDFIQIDMIHKMEIKAECPVCGLEFSKIATDEESGLCSCPNCGYEREAISHNSSYKDSQRVNIGNRNNYDDCENFRKALMRYQGKQPHKPPEKLYEQLDEYFIKIGKQVSSEIKKLPSTPEGKKKGTSRQLMFEALGETNNSAYYDDINLIMHNYWGWDLPDISDLEEQIMEDYINTQQVYNSIPNKDRNASLNIQFRLFVHLKALDYPCTKEDFKIQTSRDSLEFHQMMWKVMCEKTGIKFHPIL
jgi:hypothetical protein